MLTETERLGLKAVSAEAFTAAGGQEACASISTRIKSHNAFSEYGNPEHPGRYVPVDVALEVDRYNLRRGVKAPLLVRHLAGLLGFDLVMKPTVAKLTSSMSTLTHVAKEGYEAVAALADYIDSGNKATATQQRKAIKEIDEAIEALYAARARIAPGGEGE